MKIKELQFYLKSNNIDLAFFFNEDSNLVYFSGVKCERACLAIPVVGKPVLFVMGFEADRIAESTSMEVVRVAPGYLDDVCRRFPASRIGVVPKRITYDLAHRVQDVWNAELVSIEAVCTKLRLCKSDEEVKRITKACAFTDVLFDELCSNFSRFRTELEAVSFLKYCMSEFGLEPSFPPIVASGENAAVPHHVANKSELSGFTVIDFGVVFKNYCSDMTRTVFVGSPSVAQKKIYSKVLAVQKKCADMVVPGASFESVDDFAHKELGSLLVHRLGHSLGVEVHDVQPRPWMLEVGNVVTVEPGVYSKGKFGIRIEDDVLVSSSPIVLNKSSKELITFR